MTDKSLAAAALAAVLLAGAAPAHAASPVLHPGIYMMKAVVQTAGAGCPFAAGAALPGSFVYPGVAAGNKGAEVTLRAVDTSAGAAAAHAQVMEMPLGAVPAAGWSAVAATGTARIGSNAATKAYAATFTANSASVTDPYSVAGTFTLHLKLSAKASCDMAFSYGAIITSLL